MKRIAVILMFVGIGLFFVLERGEKPLSAAEMERRLALAGFTIEPQEKLLLYTDQEAILPEIPETLRTMRLRHSDGGSTVVTAASFGNEKVSHFMNGKTRGFPSRNWFFFGGIDTRMTRQVQQALVAGRGDYAYRFKVSDVEPNRPVPPPQGVGTSGRTADENVVVEEVLTRTQVLDRFKVAGLTINRIEENKGMPGSVKRKLPVEPLDDFLLFIEDEGVFPIEFRTAEDSIRMHQKYKKGFRHGNWYFPGQITSELRDKLVSALALD